MLICHLQLYNVHNRNYSKKAYCALKQTYYSTLIKLVYCIIFLLWSSRAMQKVAIISRVIETF